MMTFDEALAKYIDGPEETTNALAMAFEEDLHDSGFIKTMCDGLVKMMESPPEPGDSKGEHWASCVHCAIKAAFVSGLAVGREMEKQ